MCVAATASGKVYIVFVNGKRESSQLAKLGGILVEKLYVTLQSSKI